MKKVKNLAGRPLKFDRDEVLAKTLHLFWDRGYAAVSMDHLCHTTGLSKPSFYNSFGSKEDLFLECFKAYNERFVTKILAGFAGADNFAKGLRSMLEVASQQFCDPHLPNGCLAITGAAEAKGISRRIDSAIVKCHAELLSQIENCVTKYRRKGARRLTQFAAAQLYALAVMSKLSPELFDFDSFITTQEKAARFLSPPPRGEITRSRYRE